MQKLGRVIRAAVLTVLALGAGVGTALAQQVPSLTGKVTDKASGRPIGAARITVLGTSATAETNAEGKYTIRAVLSGTLRVRVNAIGYQSETKGLTITGTGATIDFAIAASAVVIDEIVATATGEQSRLEIGHAVATIKADSIAAYQTVSSLSDVLNGRSPGVTVQTSGGTTGGGSKIRIRGANSISLSNDPLIYVDGVRVNGASGDGDIGGNTGGQAPSRLNDLNPDEIESIDILKGPAASTLYGTDASSGVIVIKTKRGTAGKTVWNIYAEGGSVNDKNRYPANFTVFGLRNGASSRNCTLFRQDSGACSTVDSAQQFNTLRDPATTPYGTGYRQQYGLNVSGGTEALRYFVSGDFDDEVGALNLPSAQLDTVLLNRGVSALSFAERRPNANRRVALRSTVSAQASSTVDLNTSLGYVNSDGRFPQNDNNLFGVVSSAALGGSTRETGWGFFTPGEVFGLATTQTVNRITGSQQVNWRPKSWLTGRFVVGLDQTQRQNVFFAKPGEAPAFASFEEGFKTNNKRTNSVYTVDANFSAVKKTGDFSSKTTVGVQWFRTSINGALTQGAFFPPSSSNIGGSAQQQASDTRVSSATAGAFIEQAVGFKDKLYITAAIRGDRASAFGNNFGTLIVPKGEISYVLRENGLGTLGTVRLRAAAGASSRAPGAFDALQFFTPVQVATPNGTISGLTNGALGNADLKPEKAREFEAGLDATLFDNRLSVELTAYDKKTSDALVRRPLPPSLGTGSEAADQTSQFANLGTVKNQGVELGLTSRVLNGKALAWDVTLTGSLLRNRLVTLGEGISPFNTGFTQRIVPGTPLGGYWDFPLTWNDANGNGLVGQSEVTVGDTTEFIGAVLPTREVSLNSAFSLFDGKVRLSTQLDYRGGNYADNATENFRCGPAARNCAGLYDNTLSVDEQVRATAAQFRLGDVQKADFVRLREVSLTFFATKNIARTLGADRASLTFSGRNLGLWTKYRGVDPEANNFGQANFASSDFLTQPPVRYITARVNLTY